nr:FUSC family membrane protein [uncultured Roseateles sp.]
MALRLPKLLLGLPSYGINGIAVALGIALIQIVIGASFGTVAALTAATGAILGSLADVPLAPRRTRRRVLTAALLGCGVSLLVSLLKPWPMALGAATVLLSFAASMTLVWGVRAGPISFVPILALVFTMATPPSSGLQPLLVHGGWTLLGAVLYLAWASCTSTLLQPRLRTLALAAALEATADLLRSRGELLAADDPEGPAARPLQDWIKRQMVLDERLQAARDLLFAAPEPTLPQRQIAMLLLAIDLRDTLLASELDLELLGRDAAAHRLRQALAAAVAEMAMVLDGVARAVRLQQTEAPALSGAADTLRQLVSTGLFDHGDRRERLATLSLNRAGHMRDDLARIQAALRGEPVPLPLSHAELQLFVSPEGWPLQAVRAHLSLASPVLRHALRMALALGCAYFIALALPWASHPHWLVLSVAVVLRGNLEQTLARRDARVAGTMLGCVLVLGLSLLGAPWLSTLIFLLAVGIAHAFVTRRYLVTATAATVMALLQAHLAHPAGGFGIGERLADTVLGALLAWGFSYVLPWWERRSLKNLLARVLRSLGALARESLRWPEGEAPDLQLRLARREVFDAMGVIATSAQRTRAEPERVRLPLFSLAALLVQAHVLLAQLAALRTLLKRRRDELDATQTQAALQAAAAQLAHLLAAPSSASNEELATLAGSEAPLLSLSEDDASLMPWLHRRLAMITRAAARVTQAARALKDQAGGS